MSVACITTTSTGAETAENVPADNVTVLDPSNVISDDIVVERVVVFVVTSETTKGGAEEGVVSGSCSCADVVVVAVSEEVDPAFQHEKKSVSC